MNSAGRLFAVRILLFLTHPIQYQSPLVRKMVESGIDLHVVYATDRTNSVFFDAGYGRELKWGVDLLSGYPHTVLEHEELETTWKASPRHFARGIRKVIEQTKSEVVWINGWSHPFLVAAWREGIRAGLPVIMRGDTFLGSIRGGLARRVLHRWIYSHYFKSISSFLAIGTLNRELYLKYGVPKNKIFMFPHSVDNEFFQKKASEAAVRKVDLLREYDIAPNQPVLFFCGRLSEDKDPLTLISAMSRLAQLPEKPILLMAGDGNLRASCEKAVLSSAPSSVKFLGFQDQTQLPALYSMCDIFVLPSTFEPWGLVVNEAMNAAKPIVVSDMCGCSPDLIKQGINGGVFRAGSVDDLCAKLGPWIQDATLRSRGGAESLRVIQKWGMEQDVDAIKRALNYLAEQQIARLG